MGGFDRPRQPLHGGRDGEPPRGEPTSTRSRWPKIRKQARQPEANSKQWADTRIAVLVRFSWMNFADLGGAGDEGKTYHLDMRDPAPMCSSSSLTSSSRETSSSPATMTPQKQHLCSLNMKKPAAAICDANANGVGEAEGRKSGVLGGGVGGEPGGRGAVANVIGDIHKRRREALRWLQINYEVSVKSSKSCQSLFSKALTYQVVYHKVGFPVREDLGFENELMDGNDLGLRAAAPLPHAMDRSCVGIFLPKFIFFKKSADVKAMLRFLKPSRHLAASSN